MAHTYMPLSSSNRRIPLDVWFVVVFLFVLAGADFLMIEKMPRLFYDMGVSSLPSTTAFVLHWRFLFDALAIFWPVVCIPIGRVCPISIARMWIFGVKLAGVTQTVFTFYTLWRPLHYPYSPFI
jgi:hypothetical protein